MEPSVIGTRLASAAMAPLLKKLLVSDGPGAGLPGAARRIRLSGLVSFRGEKRTLTEKDVRKLAATLVERATAGPGERPFPADETEALTDTLAATLLALGDLDMDDVQAVHLGAPALARALRAAAPAPDGLSTDSVHFLGSLTEWACVHILEFFTQRSTFVARSLVEQTRGQAALTAKVDEVIRRTPRVDARDAEFERRYLAYVARKHGSLQIYGVDLDGAPERWPLDVAYLSLEATGSAGPPLALLSHGEHGEEARRLHLAALQRVDTHLPSDEDLDAFDDALGDAALGVTGPGTGVTWTREQSEAVRAAAIRLLDALDAGGPADQALARHDKVLLRGLAGSGKTTLVQWLAVSATREDLADDMAYLRDRIPFVLPLRTLTRHGERLPAPDRFLASVGCPLSPPDGWADRVLAAGRGLILVDGIDEIPEAERERARRWLRDLLDSYEGNRWLVTSRPTAVREDWLTADGFAELALAPMSTAEVTTFVRRWHRAAGPDAAPYEQQLLDALRSTSEVAQLATNPLMCGLICALHRSRRGFLPRGRKALYDAALSMLLSRRDRERDMGTPYGIELGEAPQIQLIQRIAYWLTLNGRTTMDRSHAESVVREAVPAITEAAGYAPDAVFTHLLHRSGLLREPTADTVDFVHRTFQDYLAAKALVDRWDIGVLVQHAADDQWEDVIRMAVGHARPRECAEIFEELLRAVDAAPDRRTRLRVLVVAATALDHATEVAPEIRDRVLRRTAAVIPPSGPDEARELASVGRAVLDLLPGPEGLDDEAARAVVITATHITDEAALPYLARFTRHENLGVRSQLMWGWSRFDPTVYAAEIIARLDPSRLKFTIVSDAHAAEIVRLGLLPEHLELRGRLTSQGAALLSDALGSAKSLVVQGPLGQVLESFPLGTELEALTLSAYPQRGFGVLRRLTRLRGFTLVRALRITADDWRVMADLGALTSLSVPDAAMQDMPDSLRLRVRRLDVDCTGSLLSLEAIARTFPDLEELALWDFESDPVYDLTPLASLAGLTRVSAAGARFTGTEHLRPTVEVVT
ncbi:NACHT domain-containing protein [Streptomyces sp. NPDC014870]|uniref:NACHT domain-containing protein n=1 Tax=Streptomyces sp. NPDC014870 TaxID=3364925 RepID=UPI00370236C5